MRRAGAVHREILPDPKYGSRLVAKFVNMMMYGGKKSTAEHIMYSALGSMEERAKQDALKLFKSAVDNCKPAVEVRPDRRVALSMRWLIGSARRRSEKSMADKLAGELLDAVGVQGRKRSRSKYGAKRPKA